jgi:hypothetical protein
MEQPRTGIQETARNDICLRKGGRVRPSSPETVDFEENRDFVVYLVTPIKRGPGCHNSRFQASTSVF